jgi:hypothetical protein
MLNKKTKKIILTVMMVLFLIRPSYSYAWDAVLGALTGVTYDRLLQTIMDAVVGALKQEAAQQIDDTVNNAIGGGLGGPKFITDWKQYLILDAQKNTDVYVNNLLTQTYSGRGSSLYSYGGNQSNSAPSGSYNLNSGVKISTLASSLSKEGVGGNYFNNMINQAKNSLDSSGLPKPDIQNYTSNPQNLFAEGWAAPIKFFGNPANTEMGLELNLSMEKMSKLQEEQISAQTQAIANQGYKALMKNGEVVTPGATLAAIQANTEDLGNKIVAGASSVPEVITALVSRLLSKALDQGLSSASSSINNLSSKVQTNIGINPQSVFNPKY